MKFTLSLLLTLSACSDESSVDLRDTGDGNTGDADTGDANAEVGDGDTGDGDGDGDTDTVGDTGDGDGDTGSDTDTDGDTGGDGGDPALTGCSDGFRDGLDSLDAFPYVAACAGAWTEAGLATADSCENGAGDDFMDPSGQGCAAADVCAAGWHVCETPDEVDAHLVDPLDCDAVDGFFATMQSGPGTATCTANGTDDLFGCGTGGNQFTQAACKPLNTTSGDGCSGLTGWDCRSGGDELNTAVNSNTSDGVLCCADAEWEPPPAQSGCADGTREGLTPTITFPEIAACIGRWTDPGLETVSACNNGAGDDADDPTGTDCSAADVCALNWHVCATNQEIEDLLDDIDACSELEGFYVAQQSGSGNAQCDNVGSDDLFGCGSEGIQINAPSCAPLDVHSGNLCGSLTDRDCGNDPAQEVANAVNGNVDNGTLCCLNGAFDGGGGN